jgi:hypothetical protein
MCTKCSKQVLWAFEKSLAGKKIPAGTRLGTAALKHAGSKLEETNFSSEKVCFTINLNDL